MTQPKPQVLLLTNDLTEASLISMVLKASNIDVSMVFSDLEMISALDIALPDLILADWDKEGMNGRAIVTAMRTVAIGVKTVPSILMTDRTLNEVSRINLAVDGFRWVLEKPVVVTSLPKLIQHTLIESWNVKQHARQTQFVHFGDTASSALMESVR